MMSLRESQVISFCARQSFSVDPSHALRHDARGSTNDKREWRSGAHQRRTNARHTNTNARTTFRQGESRLTWDFLQRYDDSWIWRCTDRHAVTESARNFAALEECVADAVRHGYVASREKSRSGARAGGNQGQSAGQSRPPRR